MTQRLDGGEIPPPKYKELLWSWMCPPPTPTPNPTPETSLVLHSSPSLLLTSFETAIAIHPTINVCSAKSLHAAEAGLCPQNLDKRFQSVEDHIHNEEITIVASLANTFTRFGKATDSLVKRTWQSFLCLNWLCNNADGNSKETTNLGCPHHRSVAIHVRLLLWLIVHVGLFLTGFGTVTMCATLWKKVPEDKSLLEAAVSFARHNAATPSLFSPIDHLLPVQRLDHWSHVSMSVFYHVTRLIAPFPALRYCEFLTEKHQWQPRLRGEAKTNKIDCGCTGSHKDLQDDVMMKDRDKSHWNQKIRNALYSKQPMPLGVRAGCHCQALSNDFVETRKRRWRSVISHLPYTAQRRLLLMFTGARTAVRNAAKLFASQAT